VGNPSPVNNCIRHLVALQLGLLLNVEDLEQVASCVTRTRVSAARYECYNH
jgi:hypothetical protein